MKITMYELIGMIKDGKAPKKIKYINLIWKYDKEVKDYLHDDLYLIYSMNSIGLTEREVEIIGEEKKIPEKLDYCEENTFMEQKETTYLSPEERRLLDSNFKELGNKINSIIDYLKSKGE